MRWLITVSLALLLVVQRPGPAFAASPITLDTLKNFEYTITDFQFFGSRVTPLRFRLQDGVFDLPNDERDTLREQITAVNAGRIPPPDFLTPSDVILETVAFGDLDGDGVDDALVVVGFSVLTGPDKFEVIPIFNRSGQPQQGSTTFIGIRKQVTSLSIRNGSVVLGMIDQNQFGQRQVVTLHLVNDRLEEVTRLPATGGTPLPIGPLLLLGAGLIAVGSRLRGSRRPNESLRRTGVSRRPRSRRLAAVRGRALSTGSRRPGAVSDRDPSPGRGRDAGPDALGGRVTHISTCAAEPG